MCGRFTLIEEFKKILEQFGITESVNFKPNYNITPSLDIPVVRPRDNGLELALCRWGLIPHWSKPDHKFKAINARAETLSEKPSFRDAYRKRRCLIPANGFFEWKKQGNAKQPYYIRLPAGRLFAFAGLWETWQGPDDEIQSCAIITTSACEDIDHIHPRMPVILDPGNYNDWLHEGGSGLLQPFTGKMEFYPVSKSVNNPKNNDASLIEKVGSDHN